MTLLYIDIAKEVVKPYIPFFWKILVCIACTLLAIYADLRAGKRKSKKLGIYSHTYGYDRTLDKIRRRLNLHLSVGLIDILLVLMGADFPLSEYVMIPYCSLIFSIIFISLEVKSIFEKDEDKGRYIEQAKIASKVAENLKGDIDPTKIAIEVAKHISNLNNNKTNEHEQTTDN